jgi:Sec-independent protein secretion pathway component TatC
MAALPAVLGGLLVAIPIWKIQKYFISKRDYYRNSPAEIFDIKFIPTSAVFLFVAGIIYVYLVDKYHL